MSIKVLCLTALYGRHEVTEICFMGLDRLRAEFDITVLAVYTGDFADLCKRYNVHSVEYKNRPLGEKWNAGLQEAMKFEWDYVMTLGSDDLLSNELLRLYNWKDEAFGISKCALYDVKTGRTALFDNSYILTPGRCIRRDVIESLGDQVVIRFTQGMSGPDIQTIPGKEIKITRKFYDRFKGVAEFVRDSTGKTTLWPDNVNNGLDRTSDFVLATNGVVQKVITTDKIYATDLKSDTNIWPFEFYEESEVDALWFCSQQEKDAIRKLRSEN